MPYRHDLFTQGQYYHIYNRGGAKAKIFFNDGNYQSLLRLVKEYYQKHGFAHSRMRDFRDWKYSSYGVIISEEPNVINRAEVLK